MQQVRRSRYLFFSIEDTPSVDIGALLRGEVEIAALPKVCVWVLATAERHELTDAEFLLLSRLPASSWASVERLLSLASGEEVDLSRLCERGLLVVEGSGDLKPGPGQERERLLEEYHWHPSAALYHFMDREELAARSLESPIDISAMADAAETDAASFVERHGPPPTAFVQLRDSKEKIDLPLQEKKGDLYEALRNRTTIRSFATDRDLEIDDLATLLEYTFGCRGFAQLDQDVLLLHKTSPSGGSLHPIEAYPLILNVESLPPGLYHYDARNHALEILEEIPLREAKTLAIEVSNGQLYAENAQVLVLLTARFYRNQWKYRRMSRTYGVMLMDAGHLSQTFYLVATDLGLGAFYTAAINGPLIERRLGLNAAEEGAVGICGCGVRAPDGESSRFRPFIPRKTNLW